MQDKDTAPPSTAQARQTVRLVTSDRQIVRLVASPLVTGQAERVAAVKAERARKPSKPRDETLVKRAEKATGKPATGITYRPDGTRTVAVGDPLSAANGTDASEREIVL